MTKINWLDLPEEDNYIAAVSYLTLHFTGATKLVANLKKAKISYFMAKDIFRASGLPLLGISNVYLNKCLHKIKNKEQLSPILLVRSADKLYVADGYHRLCAVYQVEERAWIPCKMI